MKSVKLMMIAALPLALGACALTPPPARVEAPLPSAWQAPLPHNGSLTDLSQWWRQQGDALLVQLIEAAQAASPSIATAQSRIAQSRADRVAAGAALLPSLDAGASVVRSSQQSELPTGTTSQVALQASWEIDVFGARRAGRTAAQARLAGAQAAWHEARVSVAAETATQYYGLRACEQLLVVARADAQSRADTARITLLAADAGFQAPGTAAQARASAADGSARATLQRAQCDAAIKALVALTAIDEPDLRARLAAATPQPAPAIVIDSLPAHTLAQRPDLFNAEREVAAASADVGTAQAARYPRLTLQGSVGQLNFRTGGETTSGGSWSLGPLALTVPVFDAGTRRANVDAATARYDAAVVAYRASARQAVREVEEALVNLGSAAARSDYALAAQEGYRIAFQAADDRYKSGLGSLLELEDARRTRLAADNAVVSLQRERSAAWVALYRAAGGGWTPAATTAAN